MMRRRMYIVLGSAFGYEYSIFMTRALNSRFANEGLACQLGLFSSIDSFYVDDSFSLNVYDLIS